MFRWTVFPTHFQKKNYISTNLDVNEPNVSLSLRTKNFQQEKRSRTKQSSSWKIQTHCVGCWDVSAKFIFSSFELMCCRMYQNHWLRVRSEFWTLRREKSKSKFKELFGHKWKQEKRNLRTKFEANKWVLSTIKKAANNTQYIIRFTRWNDFAVT